MKLHTVFISYNRLDLTRRALESYLQTVSVPYTYLIVDNASTDGTREWLQESGHPALLLDENRFPGYACNRGWEQAPPDADFLHRADNDFSFLPGWCQHVQDRFRKEHMGQVGLRTDDEELRARWNVGGNCVIRRELWEKGLRYDERPWPEFPPGYTEDSFFSPAVEGLGYKWRRVREPCIVSLANESPSDDYYIQGWRNRNILEWALERYGIVRETQ